MKWLTSDQQALMPKSITRIFITNSSIVNFFKTFLCSEFWLPFLTGKRSKKNQMAFHHHSYIGFSLSILVPWIHQSQRIIIPRSPFGRRTFLVSASFVGSRGGDWGILPLGQTDLPVFYTGLRVKSEKLILLHWKSIWVFHFFRTPSIFLPTSYIVRFSKVVVDLQSCAQLSPYRSQWFSHFEHTSWEWQPSPNNLGFHFFWAGIHAMLFDHKDPFSEGKGEVRSKTVFAGNPIKSDLNQYSRGFWVRSVSWIVFQLVASKPEILASRLPFSRKVAKKMLALSPKAENLE